jgi:hypothetical protein
MPVSAHNFSVSRAQPRQTGERSSRTTSRVDITSLFEFEIRRGVSNLGLRSGASKCHDVCVAGYPILLYPRSRAQDGTG